MAEECWYNTVTWFIWCLNFTISY